MRGDVALSMDELLTIDVPNGTQPCNKFGLHPSLDYLQGLYNSKEARVCCVLCLVVPHLSHRAWHVLFSCARVVQRRASCDHVSAVDGRHKPARSSPQAAFIANIGALVEPITKHEYNSNAKTTPPSLFAHNIMQRSSQNLHAQTADAKGVLGRIADVLYAAGGCASARRGGRLGSIDRPSTKIIGFNCDRYSSRGGGKGGREPRATRHRLYLYITV